jgi:tetratricopeptide (TPR) repeat protein
MYFQQGKYDDATEFCEQALEWASIINNYELRATIFNTLGAIKSATGELAESIKIFKLCLADFQSVGNAIRQGYVLLNIGLTQTELKQYAEAVISLNQSLAIALEEKDLSLVEICYQNIAKCYMAQDEIHLAKSVLDTARKILPGLISKALETELNYIDGQICRMLGDYRQARSLLEEAFWMAEDNKMTSLTADILKEQALLAQEEGNSTKAESYLSKAIREYNNLNMPKAVEKAQQEMASLKTRKAS